MRTATAIILFIITGLCTALFFAFDIGEASKSLVYDDEQEGIKDEVVIKFSHVVAENTPKGMAARRFASLVQERTNGEVKVQIYSNGTLYNDSNEYEALKKGHVQMIAPATSKLANRFPRWQVLDLPFAFPTYDAVTEAYEGTIGKTLTDDLVKDDVKGLTFWYNGYKQITNNSKPIITPTDFTRIHFRIMPSPSIESQFEQLHASTSVLPFNKTYRNLEVEFVDGQENTFSNIYSKKLHKEQNHMTISNHAYLGNAVLMNGDFWDGLSPKHQLVIKKSLEETTEWIQRHSIEINDEHKRKLKQSDSLQIHYLTNEQRETWKQTLEPVYDEVAPIAGKKLMNEIYRIRDKYSY